MSEYSRDKYYAELLKKSYLPPPNPKSFSERLVEAMKRKKDGMEDPKNLYKLGNKMMLKAEAIRNIAGELQAVENAIFGLPTAATRLRMPNDIDYLKADPHGLPGYADIRNKAMSKIFEIIKETEQEHMRLLYERMQELGKDI